MQFVTIDVFDFQFDGNILKFSAFEYILLHCNDQTQIVRQLK